MSTLNHKWLATAIIPSDIIDQVMLEDYAADDAMVGVRSDWGDVTVNKVPTFSNTQSSTQEATEEAAPETATETTQTERTYSSPEEQTFYEMFYELDYDSMQSYLAQHPDALSNGWGYINTTRPGSANPAPTSKPPRAIRFWLWMPRTAFCFCGYTSVPPGA